MNSSKIVFSDIPEEVKDRCKFFLSSTRMAIELGIDKDVIFDVSMRHPEDSDFLHKKYRASLKVGKQGFIILRIRAYSINMDTMDYYLEREHRPHLFRLPFVPRVFKFIGVYTGPQILAENCKSGLDEILVTFHQNE